MLDEKSTKIGLLADITGEYFIARLLLEGDNTTSERASGINGVRIGQVGSYLCIKQSNLQTLVMVERSYRIADGKGHAAQMVRLTPLGELSEEGVFTKGISLFPSIGDEVHVVSQEHLARIFCAHGEVEYKIGLLRGH